MKTLQPAMASAVPVGEVRLARLRLAKAETRFATARDQARLARQRRKAAKQAARQARKLAQLAKAQVADACRALAKLEAKLARARRTSAQTKSRKTPVKKAAVASMRKRPAQALPARPRSRTDLKMNKPAARRGQAKPAVSLPADPEINRGAVLAELETPVAVIPPSDSKPTSQIIKGIEEIFTGETEAAASGQEGTAESLTPENGITLPPDQPAAPATIISPSKL